MATKKTKKVSPGAARITRKNIVANVYSYEYTETKEKTKNADSTDQKLN